MLVRSRPQQEDRGYCNNKKNEERDKGKGKREKGKGKREKGKGKREKGKGKGKGNGDGLARVFRGYPRARRGQGRAGFARARSLRFRAALTRPALADARWGLSKGV